MDPSDFPAPSEGFVVTYFLVVSDQDRSREFYRSIFDAIVVLERDPVILKIANTWLILNDGGGPTDDKPTVTLTTPPDPDRTSAFLNVRVADKRTAQEAPAVKDAIERESAQLEGRGRVLVRPSGTEPMVRVMVEAPTADEADAVCARLVGVVEAEAGA